MNLNGKVVIVTGAATGIGRGAAIEFASLGAKVVVVTGRNVAGGEDTVRVIREAGGEVVSVFGGPPPLDGESAIVSTNGRFTEELRRLM